MHIFHSIFHIFPFHSAVVGYVFFIMWLPTTWIWKSPTIVCLMFSPGTAPGILRAAEISFRCWWLGAMDLKVSAEMTWSTAVFLYGTILIEGKAASKLKRKDIAVGLQMRHGLERKIKKLDNMAESNIRNTNERPQRHLSLAGIGPSVS